jgi:hypothetical protein
MFGHKKEEVQCVLFTAYYQDNQIKDDYMAR